LEALIWLTSACPDLALVFLSAARVSAQDPFEIRIYEYEPLAQKSGRLLPLFFRGLLSVHSRYGLHARGVAKRPFTSKAPTAPLPRLPLRLLPGGANQFPGGNCTRWSPAPFTAHCYANDPSSDTEKDLAHRACRSDLTPVWVPCGSALVRVGWVETHWARRSCTCALNSR
jgi:hypothetical protein